MAITTIGTAGIADNTITGAKVALASQAAGDVMYYNGTDWIRVGIGTDGQVLTVNNAENAPGWEAVAAGGATIGNSPTANELVTVASTTSNLDAESALTFDGAGEFTYDTATGSTNFIIHNSATSGSYNHSRLILRLAEANTTGDTYITFQEQNVYEYAMGVDNSDGNKFKISGSALGTNDKLIIESAGDVTVKTGNLVIGTHGKGIDFAANTQDEIGAGSVSSEILDDYEVGTFSPALTDSSGVERQHSGSGKFGHYTKIGNRVFFNLRVVIVGAGSATGSSLAQIRGLPFVCDSTANSETGFPIGYAAATSITATASLIGLSDANGNSHMYIKIWDTSGGTTNVTLNELTTDATLNVAGQYEVD